MPTPTPKPLAEADRMPSLSPRALRLKSRLTARGISYGRIALAAGVSWNMVWLVINERRKSKRVETAIRALLAEKNGGPA